MFISELEEKTGLTRHTIRFYEKEGFLEKRYIRRGVNNYRNYSEDAVALLLNIKAGQAAGFTLAELKEIREADETNELTIQRKVVLIRQKIDDIDRKKAELDRIQTYLASILASKLTLIPAEENGSAPCDTCTIPGH
jgi:MerR family transcriptional regulator, copper efflux regulator